MSRSNPPGVDRRACLAAVGVAGASALAGCISGSTEDRGEFEADRTETESSEECPEEELVDEGFLLAGRAVSVVIGSAAREWRVEMQSGEELNVALYNHEGSGEYGLPGIVILDPDGNALVEKRDHSSNFHAITSSTDGTYTVRVRNQAYTEGHRYGVEITWYGATGCAE
jgi:hypothetical protein